MLNTGISKLMVGARLKLLISDSFFFESGRFGLESAFVVYRLALAHQTCTSANAM